MLKLEDIKNKILCGNSLEVLKTFPDECIDCVITSPPYYGLRRYGDYKEQIGLEDTFAEFMVKILEITAELKRVLKPSGQFWLNFGDCYGAGQRKTNIPDTIKSKRGLTGLPQNHRNQGYEKSMLLMPERIAIAMCDTQGWILRNKIKWAKQVYLFKDKITKGSVMPTSVRDRFNESGEEFYFFVKNKKYYSNLDAVRLPPQSELNFERPRMGQGNQTIYEQKRAAGIVRQQNYPESKYNKFNYRVPDAIKKQGQPQFKASEEEIKNYPNKYGKGSEFEQKFGEPWDRFGKNTKKSLEARLADTKNKDTFSSPTANIKKLLSEIRLGIKPNRGMIKYDISKRQAELIDGGIINASQRLRGFYDEFGGENNPLGKNLPTVWLIGSEPHNFGKEFEMDTDHFAIFPQALCEIPIKFGCPEKGIVLDPFMGSGTVAIVAKKLGRNYCGIELNKEYITIAEKRLAQQILF